jgi:hypothetical protein
MAILLPNVNVNGINKNNHFGIEFPIPELVEGEHAIICFHYDNVNGVVSPLSLDYLQQNNQVGETVITLNRSDLNSGSHSACTIFLIRALGPCNKVTVSYNGNGITAVVYQMQKVTLTAGNRLRAVSPNASQTATGTAVAPSLPTSPLSGAGFPAERLAVRTHAAELAYSAGQWAGTAGWTHLINGTTGAGTASNMCGLSEYRVITTDTTSSPTAPSADHVSLYQLFEEYTDGPVNQAPTANAGTDRTITLPTNTVTISGATATDPDGTVASTVWSQQVGPNTATITGGSTLTPTFSNLVEGLYTFRLTVTDNEGATATDDMLVTVNPEPAAAKPRRIILIT